MHACAANMGPIVFAPERFSRTSDSAPAGAKGWTERWARQSDYARIVICFGLVALGSVWRLTDLKFPNAFTFDEHHFVLNARNYIAHKADWNDHPPLGKLLLVPGMTLFGDNGLGWRISSAVLGIVLFAVIGMVAARLFGDRRIGLLAAAFAAADGMFLAYSRTALLDTPLTLFMLLSLYFMLRARSRYDLAISATFLALACVTKWTGVCVALVYPWLLWRNKQSLWNGLWLVPLTVAVYLLVFVTALNITGQPSSLDVVFANQLELLKRHAACTVWDNSASSRWYTWPYLTHPIVMSYHRTPSGAVRAMSSVGNVVTWYATTVAVFAAILELSQGAVATLRSGRLAFSPQQRASGFILVSMVALMSPFIFTERQSYIWHYMGAYAMGMGLLAWYVVRLSRRSRIGAIHGLFLLGGVALVALYYVPVWTHGPLTQTEFLTRLPFPKWH